MDGNAIIHIKSNKFIKLIKHKKTNKKIVFPLKKFYNTAINFIRNNRENYNYCLINRPSFWIMSKKYHIGNNNIEINNDEIIINNNKYSTFIDNKLFFHQNNLKIYSNPITTSHDFYVYNLFDKIKYKNPKKNINFIQLQNTYIYDQYFADRIKQSLNVQNFNMFSLLFDDTNSKTKFKIEPSIVHSNFTDFNRINIKNIKFDIGYILLRKYKTNGLMLNENNLCYRLKKTLNFLLKNTNKNGSYIIFYSGGFREDFFNLILSLTNYFKSIYLKKIDYEDSIGHFWIILKNFKNNIPLIDFTQNYGSNNIYAKFIKKQIYDFINNNMINIISFYNELLTKDYKNIDLYNIKTSVLDFLNKQNLPINILQSDWLSENNYCTNNDMRKFANFIYDNNIDKINEINTNINNFIYITYLHNIQYKKIKKNIKYNLVEPIITVNNYVNVLGTKFKINYNENVHLEQKKNNILTIIYDKKIIDNNKYHTQFMIINKNIDIKNLIKYKILDESDNYFYLTKIF
jgi:hypothetical protein